MGTLGTVPKVPVFIGVKMKIKGRITNIVSNIFYVEVEGTIYECTSRGIFKTKDLKPVVGEEVIIEIENGIGNILEVVDRKKYIKRPKMSNLTQLILVISSKNPEPDLLMLDKQLAFAEFLNMRPIIVINKTDLDESEANNIQKIYTNIGYTVIKTNAKENINVEELKQLLKDNISAFSGNSGVGKSTLINSIFERKETSEGEISKKNRKGKNTTTSVKLYKVGKDSYIADTPGFSNFDIYEIPYKELYKYFVEFNQYIEKCEYMDCTHIKEKICGIKEAVESGRISELRYNNFKKIYEELKDKEEHKW